MDIGKAGPIEVNGTVVGHFTPSTDGLTPALKEALAEIKRWCPEFNPNLADPPCFMCSWQKDEHTEGGSGCDRYTDEPPDDVPFFTEGYLYWLMNKDQARTILALVRNLARAAGVPENQLWRYV
jgi:hypothetical protein